MSLSAEKLTALLQSIAAFSAALATRLEGKLDLTGTAANSLKFEGKTLAEIKAELNSASADDLAALQALVNTFIARTDNPHNVTKEQVGLGLVDNFGTATDAEAIAGTATDKFVTAKNLGAFWADKVGTAPETLDTIAEIAAALQNNPDVITALQTLVADNGAAIEALQTSTAADKTALEAAIALKLDATAQAADSAKLEGKTLAEIKAEIESGQASIEFADQATAEAGTDTTKFMNPLGVAQAIAVQKSGDTAKFNGKTEAEHIEAQGVIIDQKVATALEPIDTRLTAVEEALGGGSDFLTATSDLANSPATFTLSTDPEAVEETHSLKEWFQGIGSAITAVGTKANDAQGAADAAQADATQGIADAAAAKTAADAAQAAADAAQTTADGKLDATATAADSSKLEGKTLAEIKAEISTDIDLAAVTGSSAKTIQQLDDEKLAKADKASTADVTAGTADDKYVTPLGLKSKTDAQDLAISTLSDGLDDLVDQMTAAFNTAADDLEPAPAQ